MIPLVLARVVLADDHAELLAMAAHLIGSDSELKVVKTFTSGQAVLEHVADLNPDLVILDITMPGMCGIEVAQRLASIPVKVVFLTVHDDPDYLHSALATGALGYVIKGRMATDLLPAVHKALTGHRFVSPSPALERMSGAFK